MISTHIHLSPLWDYQCFSDKDLKPHQQNSNHFTPKTSWDGLEVEGQSSESRLLIPAALWLTDTMKLEVQNKSAIITTEFPGLFRLWPRSWPEGEGGVWKLIKKQADWVQQSDNRWTHK